MKKRGFTLIELLTVIVILGILITLGAKGLRSARIGAKKAQAMVEMKSIETAIKAYVNKYGKLPVDNDMQGESDPGSDAGFSMDTVAVLTAEDMTLNPAEMVFLEPQGTSTNGTFLDPWGEQYLIFLDTNYDGDLPVVCEGIDETIRRKVAIVSVGLYLLGDDSTNDLVKSWQ
jgi:prepilin-type N-terminal cleavage/methylation domain-containing protein